MAALSDVPPGRWSKGDLRDAWSRLKVERGFTADRIASSLPDRVVGERTTDRIRTYLDEVPIALDLIAPHLPVVPTRILEVGSGIGAVSRLLAELGHEVVACEPASTGFDLMQEVAAAIDAAAGPLSARGSLRRLPVGVHELDSDEVGSFGLVFSVNVLEHVPDPYRAVASLQDLCAPGGLQVHVCPNYSFPYEPHIGWPLLPLVPRLTRRILPAHIRDDAVLRTVNFITARGVRRVARRNGLTVEFERGTLGVALDRFDADETFAERHTGLAGFIRIMRRARLDRLLAALPPGLASPMRFTVSRAPD